MKSASVKTEGTPLDSHEWQIRPLGEFAEFKNGINFGKDQKGETGVPTIDVRNMYGRGIVIDLANLYRVSRKISPEQMLARNDILFVRSSLKREGIGWTSLFVGANEPVSFCGFIIRARLVNGAEVDPTFLTYFCRSDAARSQLIAGSGKVAITNISQDVLARLPVPIPSLSEQRKIASVLGLVQRAIEQQDRMIALTTELKKALLHKLFTEGLRGEPLKMTEIGPMPERWDLVPCEDLCEMITVGVVVKPASHYVEKGVPAFRSFNVREDRLAPNALVYFSETANDTTLGKSKLRAGDVLVVRTGYPGTSCVVPKEYDGANCIDLVIVRPKAGVIRSGFLSRFFNAPAGMGQALAAKHGLAQQHLNVSAVKRTLVPVPSLEEQDEIDSALAAVQRKIALITAKNEALTDLFRILLHQLMTAQVRVHDLDLSEMEKMGVVR